MITRRFFKVYFLYTSYLIENDRLEDAYEVTKDINSLNSTLLLSQAKSWLKNDNLKDLNKFFHARIEMISLVNFYF